MTDSSERSHRTTGTGELFICFTSRLSSSSSMKLSSKSILSPARALDGPVSLPASLSRRLRTNGSLKGGQSPMFPTGGKKRGCAFDNPEPSSPKVTCIGQVRVKTKKQGKKMRTLSKRREGESFCRFEQSREGLNPNQAQNHQSNSGAQYQQHQECLPHRSQKWVHLPLTICEALRAFGAEFSCLFPCRPSCFSTGERGKEEKAVRSGEESGNGSCVAVFARWLVALQDGEAGKGSEIELVVGGEEKRERGLRRHVEEEDTEIRDEKCQVSGGATEEGEARASICVPPKNALLLMRCRSDPMRMAALANRSWESSVPNGGDDEEEDDAEEGHEDVENGVVKFDTRTSVDDGEVETPEPLLVSNEANEEEGNLGVGHFDMEELEGEVEENPEEKVLINEEVEEEDGEGQEPVRQEVNRPAETEVNEVMASLSGALAENEEDLKLVREPIKGKEDNASCGSSSEESVQSNAEGEVDVEAWEEEEAEEEERSTEEEELQERPLKGEKDTATQERAASERANDGAQSEERERERERLVSVQRESEAKKLERQSGPVLPDCLLLMMCEPKLSMEVSKETWVCSADFIRWLPERRRPVNAKDGCDDPKKRTSTDSHPPQNTAHNHQPLQQPPRSSCSLPAPGAVSMAAMIEQKLVNAVAYEPFVLTRCKSEPMRTAAAKLAPESCFWKNRKLEPHRRATFGVRAAGVGF